MKSNPNLNFLNIGTNDYKQYIKQMLLSKKIISSSLHGIILAEAYGIPALFLNTGGYVSEALMKYYDWYYSTNRFDVKMAMSLDEASLFRISSVSRSLYSSSTGIPRQNGLFFIEKKSSYTGAHSFSISAV
ncbi:MAG: polysaccharide pyruvyl transferase family protein [Clostridiales bacterium]|nr:polysaccharide pyruvyl transferase family protein [Clostridiales bacterium]